MSFCIERWKQTNWTQRNRINSHERRVLTIQQLTSDGSADILLALHQEGGWNGEKNQRGEICRGSDNILFPSFGQYAAYSSSKSLGREAGGGEDKKYEQSHSKLVCEIATQTLTSDNSGHWQTLQLSDNQIKPVPFNS